MLKWSSRQIISIHQCYTYNHVYRIFSQYKCNFLGIKLLADDHNILYLGKIIPFKKSGLCSFGKIEGIAKYEFTNLILYDMMHYKKHPLHRWYLNYNTWNQIETSRNQRVLHRYVSLFWWMSYWPRII